MSSNPNDRITPQLLQWLHSVITPQYVEIRRTYADTVQALRTIPSLSPRTDVYTHENGRSELLLVLYGTLPANFRGSTYNIPVLLWIPHQYPHQPPIAQVNPSRDMMIRPGNHVDGNGRCYHPYLAGWAKYSERSNIADLCDVLKGVFGREPPVAAKGGEQPQPQHEAPPPVPPLPAELGIRGSPTPAAHAHANPLPTPGGSSASQGPPPVPPLPKELVPVPAAPAAPARPQARPTPPPPPPKPTQEHVGVPHTQLRVSSLPGGPRPPSAGLALLPAPHRAHQYQAPQPPPRPPLAPAAPSRPLSTASSHVYAYGSPPPPQQFVPSYQSRPIPPIPQGPSPGGPPPRPRHTTEIPPRPHSYAGPASATPYALSPLNPKAGNSPTPPQISSAYNHNRSPPPPPAQLQPPILPTPAPAPPKAPIPDLLDAQDTDLLFSLPNTDLSERSAAPPPLPPNPQKEHLIQSISKALHNLALETHNRTSTALSQATAQREAILRAESLMKLEQGELAQIDKVCEKDIGILQERIGMADNLIREVREGKHEIPDVDKVVCAPTVVHTQLYDLVTEDMAIEDTIYVLGKALDRERIGLDVFLKHTRTLAREQFLLRATVKKIVKQIGLNPM